MKAYKGSFKKKNGEIRNMFFAHIEDLPDIFLDKRIIGTGVEKRYPEGMKLVWDIEEDDFRIFNAATQIGELEQVEFGTNYYNG